MRDLESTRRSQCERKHRYDTMREATQEAVSLVAKGLAGADTMRGYHCRFCGGVHIGNVRRADYEPNVTDAALTALLNRYGPEWRR